MKKVVVLFTLSIVLIGMVQAKKFQSQTDEKKTKFFYFGPGLVIGGFYPSKINDYMTDYYSNVSESVGTFAMLMYFGANATASFFLCPYTELQLEGEYVFSPKFIFVNDKTDYFSLRRTTPALKFNFHIPIGRRVSYYIGAGGSYSFVSFKTPEKTYKGDTPGFSFQTGVMLRFRKIAIQPGFTFNFIKADTDDTNNPNDYYGGGIDELSYVGGQIGCKVLF